MRLETKRLTLRPWTPDDAGDLFRVASDPSVGNMAGWTPHRTLRDSRVMIRTRLASPETWAIVEKENGIVIGAIGLLFSDTSRLPLGPAEAEMFAWIGVPWWGRGYVAEAAEEVLRRAFEDLDLSRVYTKRLQSNRQSGRVQEKLGFTLRSSDEDIEVRVLGNPNYEI